jgi:SAM-dependent methyltransferase
LETILAGGVLQCCRTEFLAHVSGCRRALLLGEGPGRFLVELLRINPNAEVVCLEQSPRMIREAAWQVKRNGLANQHLRFEKCDALQWKPSGKFDLVVSHFFLDCFPPDALAYVTGKVAAATTENACWLLTDFRVPDQGWRKWRGTVVLALMYTFFRFATRLSASQVTPPDEFLRGAGFRLAARRLANFGLIHSDLWLRGNPEVRLG